MFAIGDTALSLASNGQQRGLRGVWLAPGTPPVLRFANDFRMAETHLLPAYLAGACLGSAIGFLFIGNVPDTYLSAILGVLRLCVLIATGASVPSRESEHQSKGLLSRPDGTFRRGRNTSHLLCNRRRPGWLHRLAGVAREKQRHRCALANLAAQRERTSGLLGKTEHLRQTKPGESH